jgi:hypothetical protein
MRLKKDQREALLSWISEGLTSDIINERAAIFDPPFSVTRQNVDQYRDRYGVVIAELSKAADYAALNAGLARKENRVRLLHQLADKLTADLLKDDLLWLDQVKGIGSQDNYERVEYEEFNTAEVAQLRGVLDDIAKEVGGRVQKIAATDPEGNALPDDAKYDRAISSLADALRKALPGDGTKPDGAVGSGK